MTRLENIFLELAIENSYWKLKGKKDQGEQLDILLMLPTTFWILPLLV